MKRLSIEVNKVGNVAKVGKVAGRLSAVFMALLMVIMGLGLSACSDDDDEGGEIEYPIEGVAWMVVSQTDIGGVPAIWYFKNSNLYYGLYLNSDVCNEDELAEMSKKFGINLQYSDILLLNYTEGVVVKKLSATTGEIYFVTDEVPVKYEFTNEGKHLTLTEYDEEEDEYDTIELSSLEEQKLPVGNIHDVIDIVGGK